MASPPPWTVLDTEQVQDCSVFRVHRDLVRAPRSGEAHSYWRIEAAEWVNVVPVTDDGHVVMVRQWRHGTREITLEIPGGIVDPGESPATAAARELLEESGYGGGELIPIGTLSPNPALFTNRVHSFWARGVARVAPIQNHGEEETAVELVPLADLDRRVRAGEIQHALVIAALHWFRLAGNADLKALRERAAMKPRMKLGDFLVAYLKRAGVTHIFGLPGDLVLGLFHRFGRDRELAIVTFSHEPSVGFAADGYARSTRRLGVVCVTYGAGGHNVLNPIAGAYAEQVPLLVVSGGPGEAEQKLSGVHHQAKDVEGQWRMFREVTVDARILRHPERAAEEVHEVVRAIMTQHRPGYLEIHRDLVDLPISVPPEIREWNGTFADTPSDPRKLAESVADASARLHAAKRPVLIGGIELYRAGAEREFLRLAERLAVPVVTTPDAKGCFPMDHPLHMGIHMGPFSAKAIEKRVRDADLVLALGTVLTDMNLGAAKPQVRRERSIWAVGGRVNVSFHTYTEVALRDFVAALGREKLPRFRETVVHHDNLKRAKIARSDASLRINELLLEMNHFLDQHPGYDVFAESGDSLFGGLELRLRAGGLYFSQGYYASMGFAVPAAIGAQIGTHRRALVLSGDGAFQMTGPEISHAPRHGVAPIVVLVNNSGWQIFRPVSPRPDLLAIPPWPYAELAQAWGGVGFRAETRGELREALRAAHELREFSVIECKIPPDDLSPISRKYIRESARKGRS